MVRFGLFWLVEAIIYILFTWQFGSFGGSFATALGSMGATIRLAALFENLTGVYLYAALIAGFPLFVSAYIEQSKQSPWLAAFTRVIFFYLPFNNYPVRATGVVLAIFVTLLATITSLLTAVL